MKQFSKLRVLMLIAGLSLLASACQPLASGRHGTVHPNFQIQPATELPNEGYSLQGVVLSRNGNTLSIEQLPRDDGFKNSVTDPRMDVIVTSDTTLYHDITQNVNLQEPPRRPVQQTLEPGTIGAIGANSRVTVWGTVMLSTAGNYVTAKVLVYADPTAFSSSQQ